jgi:hypothetical protein
MGDIGRRRKHVTIFAQDAGSAKFLIPVMKQIHRIEEAESTLFGHGPACTQFSLADVPFIPLSPDKPFRYVDSKTWLHGVKPDLLICGASSMRPDPTNVNILYAAKREKVETMAFLDSWKAWDRFAGYGDRNRFFPDTLGVMDETAKAHLVRLGYPGNKIYVVGHPWLETICDSQTFQRKDPLKIKRRLHIPRAVKVVSLVSQPLKGPIRYRSPQKYLSERRVGGLSLWRSILGILERMAERYQVSLCLLVRPHPRQMITGSSFKNGRDRVTVLWESTLSGDEIIVISDAMLGLDSIMLVEAMLMGKEVVTLNLEEFKIYQDDIGIGHLGAIYGVNQLDELENRLETILFSNSPLKSDHRSNGRAGWRNSTSNCLKLIQSRLSGAEQQGGAL